MRSVVEKAPPEDYSEAGSREPRQAVFKHAVAILPHGERLPVAIKSLSATGLRVDFFQNRTLPETVTIVEPSVLLRFRAEVVWQREGAAGLRVLPEADDEA